MVEKLSSESRVAELIRARVPIIAFLTSEETRASASVYEIARTLPKPRVTYEWTITEGLVLIKADPSGKQTRVPKEGHEGPDTVLKFILSNSASEDQGAVFILKDMHPFMEDPIIRRYLRDATAKLVSVPKTIVLMSPPHFKVMPDLEKDIVVIDFELPNETELRDVLDAFTKIPVVVDRIGKAKIPDEVKQSVVEAGLGLTILEFRQAINISIIRKQTLDPTIVLHEKKTIVRKCGFLEFIEPDIGMNQVGGLDILKDWARKRKRSFSKEARSFGLPTPKGILLVGVPGSGKSLTAKALANEWGRPILRFDIASAFGSLVGQSESNFTSAIKTAEAVSPCILWIDELEKALGGAGGDHDGGTSVRVFGLLLTWMSEKTAPVFVFATANDVSKLPPELMRKGRLTQKSGRP